MKNTQTLGLGSCHVTDVTARLGSAEAGRALLWFLEDQLQRRHGIDLEFINYEYQDGHNQTLGWRFDIVVGSEKPYPCGAVADEPCRLPGGCD